MKLSADRIIIIQTAFLGDVILITPLIRETKRLFPQAEIDVLVIPQTAGVLRNNPNLREILTFDKRKNKIKTFWKTLKKIKQKKYDLAITPHSSTTTALLLRLSGVPQRLGFDRWYAARHLTMKVPHYDDRGWHKIKKVLHLLSVFTDQKFDMQTELYPTGSQKEWAKKQLEAVKYPEKPIISLAPGSVWDTKKWPQEHYTELCRLLNQKEVNVIFIGGADEAQLCEDIIRESGISALNFAGQANVLDSAALIERCRLMICNDSGALHIANAVKTDVFAFFGPTVQSIGYFPFREEDRVFEIEMDCRPCGSHGGEKCPLGHHNCMKNLNPVNVYNHIEGILNL